MHQSIGIIEVQGLASAITVADTMAKVANITIRDVEQAKGFGWTTIKVEGDVASVKAAVEAGEQMARTHDSFVSMKVIPRPADDIWKVFFPEVQEEQLEEELVEAAIEDSHMNHIEIVDSEPIEEQVKKEPASVAIGEEKEEQEPMALSDKYTCNLCHDPKCTRKKGDPRQRCLHFNDKK